MRDRLIELIDKADEECKHSKSCKTCSGYNKGSMCMNYHIADYLLANGVIVLPCKVGDTVYVVEDWGYKKELKEKEIGVIAIKGTNDFSKELWEDVYGGVIGTFADFGKTVFLTKEEAEQTLKGGEE